MLNTCQSSGKERKITERPIETLELLISFYVCRNTAIDSCKHSLTVDIRAFPNRTLPSPQVATIKRIKEKEVVMRFHHSHSYADSIVWDVPS